MPVTKISSAADTAKPRVKIYCGHISDRRTDGATGKGTYGEVLDEQDIASQPKPAHAKSEGSRLCMLRWILTFRRW